MSVFDNSDIVLITETWTDDCIDISYPDFECFYLSRKRRCNSTRNSGGIAVYVRNCFVSDDLLFMKTPDYLLWLKLNGSLLGLRDDLYIGLCYIVPEGSSRYNLIDNNCYDVITDSIAYIHHTTDSQCNIILCGDFNSRTSTLPDFVQNDSLFCDFNLPDDYLIDDFYDRFSQDKQTNANGYLFLDMCKETGLRILNGRVGDDSGVGKFTFIGHKGSSVIDYVLASENIFHLFNKFTVHDANILSDHCLIQTSLVNSISCNDDAHVSTDNVYDCIDYKFKWDNVKSDQFIECLNNDIVQGKLITNNVSVESASTQEELNICVSNFVTIIDEAASKLFKKCSSTTCSTKRYKQNSWYNDECKNLKRQFNTALNDYRAFNTETNRTNMVNKRSEYKKLIRQRSFEKSKRNTMQLEKLKTKNAKEYWNLLKQSAGIKNSNIPLTIYEQYFESINNPADNFSLLTKMFYISMNVLLMANSKLCLMS